jgi:glycosyltransferase involved in cell wall biosynthesis
MSATANPLVSIIVPVYNVERYLDECIESIRRQTYERLEIIVVEDCSTDGSKAELESHLADPRVRLIQHERNSGLSAARNTGIEAATGDFVLFVDSDDAIAPALVETCLSTAMESGADVVVFDFVTFQDGAAIPENKIKVGPLHIRQLEMLEYFGLPHFAWIKFIRAGLFQNPRLRFSVDLYYEDWPFHWELGFISNIILHLKFVGCHYRLRGDSITSAPGRRLLHITESQRLMAEIVERYQARKDVRRLLARKVQDGAWFVLTTIEDSFLLEAIRTVRAHVSLMRLKLGCRWAGGATKGYFVTELLKLPDPAALFTFSFVRSAVKQVSPARRAQFRRIASQRAHGGGGVVERGVFREGGRIRNAIKAVALNSSLGTFLFNKARVLREKISLIRYSDIKYIEMMYRVRFGRKIRLNNPETWTEKLQWMKLFYRDPKIAVCTDKFSVREYMVELGHVELLNELVGVYDSAEDIDFHELPRRFVAKATHGSGWNLICTDKDALDWKSSKRLMNSWLKLNLFVFGREWNYKDLEPRIIVEKFLDQNPLIDYKYICCSGEPILIQVNHDRNERHYVDFYTLGWEKREFTYMGFEASDFILPRPQQLDRMIELARELSASFPFVRVDFYDVDNRIILGEMTFFPSSGLRPLIPLSSDYDAWIGAAITLPAPNFNLGLLREISGNEKP